MLMASDLPLDSRPELLAVAGNTTKKPIEVVNFRALQRPKEDSFCLERSKLHSYDDVVERVANYLHVDDPSKIRLTPKNCYSQQPKPFPIRYRGVGHLLEMLFHHNQFSDILYYEVLDIPLSDVHSPARRN